MMPTRLYAVINAIPIAMDNCFRPIRVGHIPETKWRQLMEMTPSRAKQKRRIVRGVASTNAARTIDLCTLSELASKAAQAANKPNVMAQAAIVLIAVEHSLTKKN